MCDPEIKRQDTFSTGNQEASETSVERLAGIGQLYTLGMVISSVAHDLNDPLTCILGYTQMLLEGKDLPQQSRTDLEKLYSAAKQASRTVGALLKAACRGPETSTLADPRTLIAEVIALRNYDIKLNGISVAVECPDTVVPLHGDMRGLRHLLLNMFMNAEQAIACRARQASEADHGGEQFKGMIHVGVDNDADRHTVTIEISDNGTGIADEIKDQIFDPFFTTHPTGHAAGMGLFICRQIAAELGGGIEAENVDGGGAVFRVRLPGLDRQG